MNRIKTLSLTLLFILAGIAAAQAQRQIGIVKDGRYVVTDGAIKIELQKLFKDAYPDAILTNIYIEEQKDADKGYFLLMSEANNGEVRLAFILTLKDNKFYSDGNATNIAHTYTICKGCKAGCSPIIDNGHLHCTTGCGKDCTKTSTAIQD